MGKKVTHSIIAGNAKGEQVSLVPGDEVPSGFDVPDEYLEGHDDTVDADHTREQLIVAAERVGVERKSLARLSKDQIAHVIREKLFADVEGGEVEPEAMELAEAENESGNANSFPATGESTASRRSTKSSKDSDGAGS